jgi:hypothetical protein
MADFERIARNAPVTLTMTFYGDSVPVDADGSVTVTVTDRLGATVSTGTATKDPAQTGVYTYNLAGQANLGMLTVDWNGVFDGAQAGVVTLVEVVGWHLFSLADVRADPDLPVSKYSDEKVRDMRTEVEDEFETICGRAFIPRLAVEELRRGSGHNVLNLSHREPRSVIQVVEIDRAGVETDVTATLNLFLSWTGELDRYDWTVWKSYCRYRVAYEYGPKYLDPMVRGAGLRYLKERLTADRSAIPQRADVMEAAGAGSIRLSNYLLSRGKGPQMTGVPEVDRVLEKRSLEGGVR